MAGVERSRAPQLAASAEVKSVWLLAGSAGATGAVQRFLNQFHQLPPVAFIYAQHYDPSRGEQLEHFTLENSAFSLQLADDGVVLSTGQVLMVPPQQRLELAAGGRWQHRSGRWSGHTPDIGEVIASLSACGVPCPGVIFFSGMGGDGVDQLAALAACGGRIWAQDPADAVCAGMPRAAIASGKVQRTGTAEALARAILNTGY